MMTQSNTPNAFRKAWVASVAEWRSLGLTDARLRSLVRSGALVRVWHGVYATRAAVEWARQAPHGATPFSS